MVINDLKTFYYSSDQDTVSNEIKKFYNYCLIKGITLTSDKEKRTDLTDVEK
jgi:hypothetical protein